MVPSYFSYTAEEYNMVPTYPAETVEPVHAAHVPPGEVVLAGVVTKQELVDTLQTG
jgi:hypothetical protein